MRKAYKYYDIGQPWHRAQERKVEGIQERKVEGILEETEIGDGHRIKCQENHSSDWISGSTSAYIQFWNC